jgi:hypothetical protein
MNIERVYAILDSIKPNAEGCMIWPRPTNGIPKVRLIYKLRFGAKHYCPVGDYTIPRLVIERGTDLELDDTKKVFSICGFRNCVNRDHLVVMKKNKYPNPNPLKARRKAFSCNSV